MPQPLNETMVVKGRILESDKTKLPKGVLCRGVWPIANLGKLNQNNRLYTRDVFESSVINDKTVQEKMKSRTLFGHAEHPDRTQSDLQLTSHVITDTFIKEDSGTDVVYQTIDVLDTPCGRIVNTLLEAECMVGVSTRAEGDLEEAVDEKTGHKYSLVKNYRYTTTDFTADPSTYGTRPMNIVREIKSELDSGKLTNEEKTFATAILEGIEKASTKKDDLPSMAFSTHKDKPCPQCGKSLCTDEDDPDTFYCQECGYGDNGTDESIIPDDKDNEETKIKKLTEKEGTIEAFIEKELIKAGVLAMYEGKRVAVKNVELKEHFVSITLDSGASVTVSGSTPISIASDGLILIPNVPMEPLTQTSSLPPVEPTEPCVPCEAGEGMENEPMPTEDEAVEEPPAEEGEGGFVPAEEPAEEEVEDEEKDLGESKKINESILMQLKVVWATDKMEEDVETDVEVEVHSGASLSKLAREAVFTMIKEDEKFQEAAEYVSTPEDIQILEFDQVVLPNEEEGENLPEEPDVENKETSTEEPDIPNEEVKEGKGTKALYTKKGLTPPKGKGIHTKKFHKMATAIAGDAKKKGAPEKDAKKKGYAIAMSKLGTKGAVKAGHRKDEALEKSKGFRFIEAILLAAKNTNKRINEAIPDEDLPQDDQWGSPELSELFSKLVPPSGKAETVEGEIVRAANKIGYRWFNDGDYFYTGYGLETAGPSAAFLLEMADKLNLPNLRKAVERAVGAKENDYQMALAFLDSVVVDYVESKEGNYTSNEYDMLDFKPKEWTGREEDVKRDRATSLLDEISDNIANLDEFDAIRIYKEWVDDEVLDMDEVIQAINEALDDKEISELLILAKEFNIELDAIDKTDKEDIIGAFENQVAGDLEWMQSLYDEVDGTHIIIDGDKAVKGLDEYLSYLVDEELEDFAEAFDLSSEDVKVDEPDEGAEVDEDEPLPKLESKKSTTSLETLFEGTVKEEWLTDAVKTIKHIPHAKKYGVGDTATDEEIASVFKSLLKGNWSDKFNTYQAYGLLVDEKKKGQEAEAGNVAKQIAKELKKLATKVKKQITKGSQVSKVAGIFYEKLHFGEKGFKDQLVFESYEEMVDYLSKSFRSMTPERQVKLVSILPTSQLNERKGDSLSEMRSLKLKEASARAEAEKAIELLDEMEKNSSSIKETSQIEVKVLAQKLRESQAQENKEVDALRRLVESKMKTTKDLQKELVEAKESLERTKKMYEQKVAQLEKAFQKKMVKEYVDFKTKSTALALPSNSRALLENCSSIKEVDKVFEEVRSALRRDALLPGSDSTSIQVHHVKPVDPEMAKLYESIGNVFDAM